MTNAEAMKFGFFSPSEIYDGRWWSLITSAFCHVEITHIFFNMYWLWILGPVIERQFGAINFLAFMIGTAFISSGWQLATGHSGIGFSGVGYAIIGFGWIVREKYPNLKPYFSDRTLRIFAGWAVLCVVLTFAKVWNIGNVAHIMGAVAGAIAGLMFVKKPWLPAIGLLVLSVCAIIPVYWSPQSADWNFEKGYKTNDRKDPDTAIRFYRRSIELELDDSAPYRNIALIEAQQGRVKEFKQALEALRKVSPKQADELAKDFAEPR